MKIFVSTCAYSKLDFYNAAEKLLADGFDYIEVSSGPLHEDWEDKLNELAQKAQIMLHNYFPPPPTPFVLNIASCDSNLRKKSILFFEKVIDINATINSTYCGIHAGFRIDPNPKELGDVILKKTIYGKEEAINNFIEGIRHLSRKAKEKGQRILIENNVLSKANFTTHGVNPLLGVDPEEIVYILDKIGPDVGLLMDVGHLKVSGETLNFDYANALRELNKYIVGYHISENNGEVDQHRPLTPKSWFLDLLDRSKDFCTLELNNVSRENLKKSMEILKYGLK